MKTLFVFLLTLLPAMLLAHSGHGLGALGHELDHALWNFLGLVVVCAGLLIWQRRGNKNK